MKKKPETPPPENSLDRLARLTRKILDVPKSELQRRESERERIKESASAGKGRTRD